MSQTERLREYAAKGMSKAEAAHREGCSHSTAANALVGTDLKWGDHRRPWTPLGLDQAGMANFHSVLRSYLADLKNGRSVEEVGHLTGMNMTEQKAVIDLEKGGSYNWTVSQISRLAAAFGMTFEQMMTEATKAMNTRG